MRVENGGTDEARRIDSTW